MSCRGTGLTCAKNIFNKLSKEDYTYVSNKHSKSCLYFIFLQIIDPFTNEKLKCLQPCSDNQYSMKTSTSGFPAKATFHYSQEACVLLLKFFEKCKTLQSWVTTHLCEETSLLFWHMIAVILTTSSSLKQQLSTLIIRAFVQQLEMKVSRINSNSSFKGEICFLMKSENIDLNLC